MIHKTANGYLWDAKPHIRAHDPIPEQMRLSRENVLEFMPGIKERKVQEIIRQNEIWVRTLGIPLVFKQDGQWFTNYKKGQNDRDCKEIS